MKCGTEVHEQEAKQSVERFAKGDKFMRLIGTLLGLVLLITGCGALSNMNSESSSSRITAEQGKTMMEDGQEYILLDVRTQEEYDNGHIEGAILIPVDVLQSRAADELPDVNARIIIYCRSGNRSATAARMLADLGYTQVYDMGGIMDWPYAIVR